MNDRIVVLTQTRSGSTLLTNSIQSMLDGDRRDMNKATDWCLILELRGDDVNQWLLSHDISHFAIIDDTPYKWDDLTQFWVRTNPHTSLSRDNVRLALQLLGVNDD